MTLTSGQSIRNLTPGDMLKQLGVSLARRLSFQYDNETVSLQPSNGLGQHHSLHITKRESTRLQADLNLCSGSAIIIWM